MPDLRLTLVDYSLVLKRYETKGLMGKGEDPIMNLPCNNYAVKDLFLDKRIKIM
jgi:hypothetical protein